MTATQHTPRRRPRTRSGHGRRLPRLGWWWLGAALIAIGIAKTWPIITALVVGVAAIGLVIAARRPAWLQRAAHRLPDINVQRTHLPARGHRTLHTFQRMTPARFEHAITALAREDHHHVAHAEQTGQTGDRGADVLITLHNGRRILIQCKHYRPGNNVSGPTVREIVGSVIAHRCHAGIIVTTSAFTAEALATNADLGRNALALIDGHGLEQWANGGTPPWT
jgi:restriction system protein